MTRRLILGIETTCDETAAAVFTDEPLVLSSVVASQADMHARFGGVVPEICSRAHVRQILPVIDTAVRDAGVSLGDLAAIAVCHTPGLIGAILVGLSAAKSLALALDVPLIGVNHLEGHIYACQLSSETSVYPCVGLVISGGHTSLYWCEGPESMELIGSTTDDAAGEAFDKVASLLGLGYPGGPAIELAAKGGDPTRFSFSRGALHEDNLDFSFSGLKTAVRYAVHGQNDRDRGRAMEPDEVRDLAASFQQTVIDILLSKTRRAIRRQGATTLCVGGGVAANATLRAALDGMSRDENVRLVIPPLALCTDNAAMTAVSALKFRDRRFDPLDLDAVAGLVRRS